MVKAPIPRTLWLIAGTLLVALATPNPSRADDPPPQAPPAKPGRTLDDPPTPFVPLNPRTTEDRNRIEALRLYTAARALEDQFQIGLANRRGDLRQPITDALTLLEQARRLDPDSVPILRRLAKLDFVIGRVDQAVAVSRKILDLDPGDTATLNILVAHYVDRRRDPAAAENLLRKVAANPKLDKSSPGYLLIERDLGDLYADLTNQPDKAADAYATLMEALDGRAARALSASDQKRILEGDEAGSYLKFGEIFLRDNRPELAIRAFRRGLIYQPDHPQLPRSLAEAQFKSGKPADALATLDPYLNRQPSGGEAYELLAEILTALQRPDEILPRLSEAAEKDPNNYRLQFALSNRYRAAGQANKADAILTALKANQTDPQIFAALAASYLKERKSRELVQILGEAIAKPNGYEAVKPQIDALTADADLIRATLDDGIALLSANPPELSDSSRKVLTYVAGKAKTYDKLLELDRLAIKNTDTALNRRELLRDLVAAGRDEEADTAANDLFTKFPTERNADTLLDLAQARVNAGKIVKAIEAGREARKIEPNDPRTSLYLAYLLGRANLDDEAIAVYEDLLKKFPENEEIVKRCRSGLSVNYINKGDNARGEGELEILLQKYPEDPGVNNDLGYLWADQGKNLARAEGMIRKALEEDPTNTSYLDSLGWVLFKLGKPREALEPLQKATEGERLDTTVCEHMADILFQLKDYARAKDFYRKAESFAAKSNPPDRRLVEIRRKLEDLEKLGPTPAVPATGDRP